MAFKEGGQAPPIHLEDEDKIPSEQLQAEAAETIEMGPEDAVTEEVQADETIELTPEMAQAATRQDAEEYLATMKRDEIIAEQLEKSGIGDDDMIENIIDLIQDVKKTESNPDVVKDKVVSTLKLKELGEYVKTIDLASRRRTAEVEDVGEIEAIEGDDNGGSTPYEGGNILE